MNRSFKYIAAFIAASLAGAASFAAGPDAEPGLVGEYFQIKTERGVFPDIEGKQPFLVRVDKKIDFPETSGDFYHTRLEHDFLAVWRGSLHVESAGEYTLSSAVDDAIRVSIDGKKILEDVTRNGVAQKSEKVLLAAGEHPMKIEFVQNGGGAACVLSWETPGGKKQVIPASVFSHAKSAEAVAWDSNAWKKIKTQSGPTSWDNYDYGPFLSASILATTPADNMTYKGVAVKLGKIERNGQEEEASICFDTQLMRMSAGWTGGFLNLRNVAYTGDHGPCPTVAGEQIFGTRNAPAWATKDGSFIDPRIALYGEAFGGMPRDYLHYKGLYRHGDQVVFSYSVNGMDVLETPRVKQVGEQAAFIRDFEIGPSAVRQEMIVLNVETGTSATTTDNLVQMADGNTVTAASLLAERPEPANEKSLFLGMSFTAGEAMDEYA